MYRMPMQHGGQMVPPPGMEMGMQYFMPPEAAGMGYMDANQHPHHPQQQQQQQQAQQLMLMQVCAYFPTSHLLQGGRKMHEGFAFT